MEGRTVRAGSEVFPRIAETVLRAGLKVRAQRGEFDNPRDLAAGVRRLRAANRVAADGVPPRRFASLRALPDNGGMRGAEMRGRTWWLR